MSFVRGSLSIIFNLNIIDKALSLILNILIIQEAKSRKPQDNFEEMMTKLERAIENE